MKVKNGFSVLRLLTVLFGFCTLVGFIFGIVKGNQNQLIFGITCLLCLIFVKLLRYMHRD